MYVVQDEAHVAPPRAAKVADGSQQVFAVEVIVASHALALAQSPGILAGQRLLAEAASSWS